MLKEFSDRQLTLALTALLLVLSGLLYYVIFRGPGATSLSDPSLGSYPSLVHTLACSWLAITLLGLQRGILLAGIILFISLGAELMFGVFSGLDTVMLIGGTVVGCLTAGRYLQEAAASRAKAHPLIGGGLLLLFSTAMMSGSYCGLGCGNFSDAANAKPLYMDYNTLRSAVAVSGPRTLTDVSRVYVYQSAVFLVNTNAGIHVLDNSDPRNPRNAAFIEIPGNTEVSIRSNYLYADSYVDLITLDISDPENVQEVNRQLDIFPYNAYQNVPDDVYFGYDGVNEQLGVVVAYEYLN